MEASFRPIFLRLLPHVFSWPFSISNRNYGVDASKFLCLETMCRLALIKSIDVVGIGDFRHPAWRKDLEGKL